jgi:hypothetical protein
MAFTGGESLRKVKNTEIVHGRHCALLSNQRSLRSHRGLSIQQLERRNSRPGNPAVAAYSNWPPGVGGPIVGGDVRIPFAGDLSFDLRADIGGFDVGSRLTWQVFPRVNWHCSKRGFLQAGYRWLYTDYETGNGKGLFGFDMLTQGPQVGVTFSL